MMSARFHSCNTHVNICRKEYREIERDGERERRGGGALSERNITKRDKIEDKNPAMNHVKREETTTCDVLQPIHRRRTRNIKKHEKTIENAALSSIFTSLGSERDTLCEWEPN